ncbi:MAG TPA: hypothetical protein VFV60_06170, partial [bacterium]|nr:hypothetical protein [bacterium]
MIDGPRALNSITPEVVVATTAMVVLLMGAFVPLQHRRLLAGLSAVGLIVAFVEVVQQGSVPGLAFGGMYIRDSVTA